MATTERVERAKLVNVKELEPWDRNPRSISKVRFEALKASMEESPDMMRARPLIALKDGRVIAGNMRLRAALELGWKQIQTVYVDLDETTALTWALRDNNPYGEWDEAGLVEMLYELDQAGIDPALTGFGAEDLKVLNALGGPEIPDDRGSELALADVSIGDPKHVVQKGEVWNVGEHLLIVESVYDGWPSWVEYLVGDALLVPYPTPTLPLTVRAGKHRLILVQPDVWLAGHVLDKYAAVRGDDQVTRAS